MTYRSRDTRLVESLVNFVKDIKPFHVKLKNFASEVFFSDSFNAAFIEDKLQQDVYLQNVWTKDDIGGWQLSNVSDGSESGRYIQLPATVFPRFAATSSSTQTPPGDDPGLEYGAEFSGWSYAHQSGADAIGYPIHVVSHVITITTAEIIGSNVHCTYTIDIEGSGLFEYHGVSVETVSCTHLSGLDQSTTRITANQWRAEVSSVFDVSKLSSISTDLATRAKAYLSGITPTLFATQDTGRYRVPFHHGSKVTVNGLAQVYGSDYVVDLHRGAIQFLAGRHPTASAVITINYFNSDRLFIMMTSPFDWNVSSGYDMSGYDDLPYDNNFVNNESLVSDTFTLTVDKSFYRWYQPIEFNDVKPGKSKPTLTEVMIYPSEETGNIWKITAVSFMAAKVQQIAPIEGPVQYASMGQRFDNGKIAFTLRGDWVPYYLVQDENNYIAYDMSGNDTDLFSETMEETDFWVDLEIQTEHGSKAANTKPVQLSPIGIVQQRLVQTEQGLQPVYELKLDETPPRGTYIEVRVEQAKQYNPRLNASFSEHFTFVEAV